MQKRDPPDSGGSVVKVEPVKQEEGRQQVMNRRLVVLCAAILAGTAVSGCSRESETPKDPESVVQENIKAMNGEDLDKAMATIDEQSASYDQTKQMAKKIFELYDLKYELDSLRVITLTDEEARVGCVQTTTKLKGPAFRDNRIDFVHTLRKVDGNWKIYNSKVMRIDYLN
jgi:hypothetical protein